MEKSVFAKWQELMIMMMLRFSVMVVSFETPNKGHHDVNVCTVQYVSYNVQLVSENLNNTVCPAPGGH